MTKAANFFGNVGDVEKNVNRQKSFKV